MEGKKKYLYMDRFEKHQAEDAEWKKQCGYRITELNDKFKVLLITAAVALVTAGFAMLVAFMK